MNKFIKDIKKYFHYTAYSAKSDLKAEVSRSYLNWLWWILDPLLFMLVYMFIAMVVFDRQKPYFPVFVFIGLTVWNFFSKTVNSSVKALKSNTSIISKVYVPKYIFVINRILVNGFKMLVSFVLVAILMILFRVPISFNIFYSLPLILILVLITFGVGTIVAHWGVFLDDLRNIISVLLKLVFYLSGVFYDITERVPYPWNGVLFRLNPPAFIMGSLRNCLIYETPPDILMMCVWTVIGLILSWIGISIIYKYENSYVKVI